MRTVRRLRLRCFTFYDSLCRAVHAFTYCPVETMAPPSEHTQRFALLPITRFGICSGGGGGSRTHVQNTFLFASYSNTV